MDTLLHLLCRIIEYDRYGHSEIKEKNWGTTVLLMKILSECHLNWQTLIANPPQSNRQALQLNSVEFVHEFNEATTLTTKTA